MNPFPGLRPFEFDENYLFFGRDGQTDELLSRLRRFRFLALVGTSGSGKSSLVRAGLLPDIHAGMMTGAGSSWRVALFKPGNDPIGNLARALSSPEAFGSNDDANRAIIETTLRRSALGLIEVVRQERAGANLLVVADQFEEIFRFQTASPAGEDEASALVKLLLEAARQSEQGIYIVLTMRSDYIGDCAQFGGLPEAINRGLYLVPRMTRDQRREAITGPVAVGGGEIAPRLVNRLLNDVGDNPDQLPLMQHALMRMWNCWQAGGAIGALDLVHYEQVGALSGALDQQANEAFGELSPRGKELAEKIFKRLTEKGGDNREVRRPATLRELIGVSGGNEDEVKSVIETFRAPGRSFLMPPADRPLELDSLIDISHESLIRGWLRLRAWVDEEAASAEIYHRLSETAELHAAGKAGLWRDPDLQLALDWQRRNQPTSAWAERYSSNFDRAAGFLADSRATREAEVATRERERRVRRSLRSAIIAILSVACIVSWLFFIQARRDRKKAERAERMALAGERNARNEALRVRRKDAENFAVADMAQRLAELSAPEEAAIWQLDRGTTLGTLHKTEDAIRAYESVLAQDPENAQAHFGLGYFYLAAGKLDQALAHTDKSLERDPKRWMAYQNRAIMLSGLGRFADAQLSLQRADETFHHSGIQYFQSELSPEIEQATGRAVILMEEDWMRAATTVASADIAAFSGAEEFPARLREARASPQPVEVYLSGINWAWLQTRSRPQDYGAFAAQGAWWESAGQPGWAKRAFLQFQNKHRETHDARYTQLAGWVDERLQGLRDEALPKEQVEAETLLVDAFDQENTGRWDEAQSSLDRIVQMEPENIRYRLARATFFAQEGYRRESQSDDEGARQLYTACHAECDAMIKLDSKAAQPYLFRAYAAQGLRAPKDEIAKDLRTALENEPLYSDAMTALSDIINKEQPEEALHLLEQSLKGYIGAATVPFVYARITMIHWFAGRWPEAQRAIETAISLKSDQPLFYGTRALIEKKLGESSAEVARHLSSGCTRAGDLNMQGGDASAAFKAYSKALEALLGPDSLAQESELAVVIARISSALERLESKQHALEYWGEFATSDRSPALREGIAGEIKRLNEIR